MSSKVTSTKKTVAKKETAPVKTEKIKAPKAEAPAIVESLKDGSPQTLCILRVRGSHKMARTIMKTLHLLNLYRVNHATIIRTTPSLRGMLQKAKDYIAFGPVDQDILKTLLKKRACLVGDKPLSDSHVANETVYKSVDDLASAIYDGKIRLKEVKDLKPVFRLHPPIGGYKGSIKKAYKSGGVLGNVGPKINAYIKRMM